ncbi:MAG: hypothetical protein RBS17_10760 [Coriobacteriia bacterium]|nr:hypothetical protein [Coriobacteriia bacterium]
MGPWVHLTLTRTWAHESGFSSREAEVIARSDVAFDVRYPARASVANITRHFAPWAWMWSRHYFHRAAGTRDLVMLGYALHCAQDAVAHGSFGENHLLADVGLRRDPDSWEAAPPGIKTRIERVSRTRLLRYRRCVSRVARDGV